MENYSDNRIQDLLNHGYHIDINLYISKGFELLKKEIGLFVAFTILFGFISMIINVIPYLSYALSILVSPPLVAGFFYAAHRVAQNERLDFADFFKGFDDYGQLVLQQLILFLIMMGIFIPFIAIIFFFESGFDSGGDIGVGMTLAIILSALVIFAIVIYLSTIYMFASMYIIFGKMQAWNAMETSRKVVAQNFFPLLGLILLLGIINFGGILLCFMGLIFTLPLTYLTLYIAFRDIMAMDNNHGNYGGPNDVFNHLVD